MTEMKRKWPFPGASPAARSYHSAADRQCFVRASTNPSIVAASTLAVATMYSRRLSGFGIARKRVSRSRCAAAPAGVNPRRPAGELTTEETDRLRRAIRAALRDAIRDGGAHTGRLIPHRELGGACPRCGGALARDTIGGRTTYWCPREQDGLVSP